MRRIAAAIAISSALVAGPASGAEHLPAAPPENQPEREEVASGAGVVPQEIRREIRKYTVQRPGVAHKPLQSGAKQVTVPDVLVEQALASLGYDVGEVDGEVTEETRSAIADYEAARGLPVTGRITPQLIAALESGG